MGILSRLINLVSKESREAVTALGEACREGFDGEAVTPDHLAQLKGDYGRIIAELEKQKAALAPHETALAEYNEAAESAMDEGNETAARTALERAMMEESHIDEITPVLKNLESAAAELKALLQQASASKQAKERENSLLETRKRVANSKEQAVTTAESAKRNAGIDSLKDEVALAEGKAEAVKELAEQNQSVEATFESMEKKSALDTRLAALKEKTT